MTLNPYAPPQAIGGVPTGGLDGVWREHDVVVVQRQGAVLPDRCVNCNAPANGFRLQKTYYWHHPAWYLLIFVSILIYAIVAMIVRKSATVALPLCATHRARRRNGLLIGWLGFLGGLALLLFGAAALDPPQVPLAVIPGLLAMIVCPIVGAVLATVARPTKISDVYAWLKCGQPFVESLPAENVPPMF
jgi:hypothetical protein